MYYRRLETRKFENHLKIIATGAFIGSFHSLLI